MNSKPKLIQIPIVGKGNVTINIYHISSIEEEGGKAGNLKISLSNGKEYLMSGERMKRRMINIGFNYNEYEDMMGAFLAWLGLVL